MSTDDIKLTTKNSLNNSLFPFLDRENYIEVISEIGFSTIERGGDFNRLLRPAPAGLAMTQS
ncbi:MAG: hypothetical protein JW816_00670 [Candidatus Buchananbacteria bacterium]|nr:hypothetical protein [Candidatus Buchananbacteria bacterium]